MSFAVRRNGGGGSRGGFVGPVRRVVSRPAPSRPVVATSRPVTITPRGQDFVSHYDPSRVIDLDKLKVVSDMRQSGSERGEVQTGDNGTMSPSEARSGTIAAGGGVPGKPGAPGTAATNNLIPLALGAAALILLGG